MGRGHGKLTGVGAPGLLLRRSVLRPDLVNAEGRGLALDSGP